MSAMNVINLFKNNFKQINYLKQKNNIGFDSNIFELYNNAKGKFIWFLSDDDFITDGSLEIVINTITQFPNLGFATFRGTKKTKNANLLNSNNYNIYYFAKSSFIIFSILGKNCNSFNIFFLASFIYGNLSVHKSPSIAFFISV